MKAICSIMKDKKPVYSLEEMTSSDMAIIHSAVDYYYYHLKREDPVLADEVEAFLKEFKNIEDRYV